MRYSQVVIDMYDSKKQTKVSNTDVLEQYINALVSEDQADVFESSAEISQLNSEALESSPEAVNDELEIKVSNEPELEPEQIKSTQQQAMEDIADSPISAIPDDQVTVVQICGVKFGIKSNEIMSIESFSGLDLLTENNVSVKARIKDRDIQVINTSQIVLPTKPVPSYEFIILLKDKDFGLACDHVEGVSTIDESDIRRSSQNTQRKWLAGTVSKLKLALLDTERLIKAYSGND